MRFAPQGARPTEIAQALAVRQNTLSHHLSDLTASGLVQVERRGRSLFYSVDLARTGALIGYLALDVARGRPDVMAPLVPASSADRPQDAFNVLFLCSGNSARSIMAEALLADLGKGRFHAFSAGTQSGTQSGNRSEPAINPRTVAVLQRNGHPVAALRSKHVSQFHQPDAPVMDFVFTVCDTAAAEDCPPWSGQPISGHWGMPDPAKATGTEAEKALVFAATYAALRRRIAAFVALPVTTLNRLSLQQSVDAIGNGDRTDTPNTATTDASKG